MLFFEDAVTHDISCSFQPLTDGYGFIDLSDNFFYFPVIYLFIFGLL